MNKILTYILFLTMILMTACSQEVAQPAEEPVFDLTWEETPEEELTGSHATVKPFECGDEYTRSSWIFDGQKLVFGWHNGDRLGIYPTARKETSTAQELAEPEHEETGPEHGNTWEDLNPGLINPSTKKHPQYDAEGLCHADPTKTEQARFIISKASTNNQTAAIAPEDDPDFTWELADRWTAYYPWSIQNHFDNNRPYNKIPFEFAKQEQNGIPDISAYKKGTAGTGTGANNTEYRRTETLACAHLGKSDVMISPEMKWEDNKRINFQLRHAGAVARLYLLAPKDMNLVITNVKLICEKKIFYTRGLLNLYSKPYNANAADGNCGLVLPQEAGSQVTPDESSKTRMLELDITDGTAKTYYDANNSYKRYMTMYIMMYPITYNAAKDGALYAYVTAYRQEDPEKKELHLLSKPLGDKTMKAGAYYQWSVATTPQEGIYPIEMEATLLPWQAIVGANISTDLEN